MNDTLRELIAQFAVDMAELQAADGDLLKRVEQFAVDCYAAGRTDAYRVSDLRESAQAIPLSKANG